MDPRPFEASVVDRLWRAALADAALGYDDVLLLSFGEHGDYYRGMAWPPDRVIEGEHDRRALGNQIDEANGAEGLGKARVAIRFDRTHEAVVAAALRHELEHVRQLATVDGEQLDDLYEVAQRVLGDEGRSAYGSEYNNIPMEVDANAAAAVFVRTLWTGETVDALVAGNVEAVLLRAANPPPPMSSLVQRMRDFIVES